MHRILILFAHPALEKSIIQRRLIRVARRLDDIEMNDLYENYPDFMIDIDREQELLRASDIILFQYPFYWYSSPSIIKEWQDLVLEYGFAHGRNGAALKGKYMANIVSTGGKRVAYSASGHNRFTMQELLRPFEQTAHLCGMTYLPPFVIHGTHSMDKPTMKLYTREYVTLLTTLQETIPQIAEFKDGDYLNDWLHSREAE